MERFVQISSEDLSLIQNGLILLCLKRDIERRAANDEIDFLEDHWLLRKVNMAVSLGVKEIGMSSEEVDIAAEALRNYADFVRDSGMTSNDTREFAASINALIELIEGGTEK